MHVDRSIGADVELALHEIVDQDITPVLVSPTALLVKVDPYFPAMAVGTLVLRIALLSHELVSCLPDPFIVRLRALGGGAGSNSQHPEDEEDEH